MVTELLSGVFMCKSTLAFTVLVFLCRVENPQEVPKIAKAEVRVARLQRGGQLQLGARSVALWQQAGGKVKFCPTFEWEHGNSYVDKL